MAETDLETPFLDRPTELGQAPSRRLNTGKARSPQQQMARCRLPSKGAWTSTNGRGRRWKRQPRSRAICRAAKLRGQRNRSMTLFRQYKPPSSMRGPRKALEAAYNLPAFRPEDWDHRSSEQNTNARTIRSKRAILDSSTTRKSRNTSAEKERPPAASMRSRPGG